MTWIQVIPPEQARGPLKVFYDAAARQTGHVPEIVRAMSSAPQTLHAALGLYQATVLSATSHSRGVRELLAVVVSNLNGCDHCRRAHQADLRRALETDWFHLTFTSVEQGRRVSPSPDQMDEFARQAALDWRQLSLRPEPQALAEWAEQMTLRPADCNEKRIINLRLLGISDASIHEALQVIAYFNYINRIASALGVESAPV